MDKISLEELGLDLKEKDYVSVYNKILDKALELLREIVRIKELDLKIPQNKEELDLVHINYVLKRNSAFFDYALELVDGLSMWEATTGYLGKKTEEEKLEIYINLYNKGIDELNYYKEIGASINRLGYESVREECISKLIILFREMMTYKKLSYNNEWSFQEWLNHIDTHYHFYHEEILDTCHMVFSGFKYLCFTDDIEVEIVDVEKIMQLKYVYSLLTEEENDYKVYADYYREYELKEGEKYQDIQKRLENKLVCLFKEMLDYLSIEYDSDNMDFEYFSSMVGKHYPFYTDSLMHLSVMKWNADVTYIVLLNCMEDMYESISKTYKNRDELMMKYEEEQGFEWPEEEVLEKSYENNIKSEKIVV